MSICRMIFAVSLLGCACCLYGCGAASFTNDASSNSGDLLAVKVADYTGADALSAKADVVTEQAAIAALPVELMQETTDAAVIALTPDDISVTLLGAAANARGAFAKGKSAHASVRFRLAGPLDDACTSELVVGPFELTIEDGIVSVVPDRLPIPADGLALFRDGQLALCVETQADFDGTISLGEVAIETGRLQGNEERVVLCHIPPGDEGEPHTLTVGSSAVDAHLAHGDYLGKCEDRDENEMGDRGDDTADDSDDGDGDDIDDDTQDDTLPECGGFLVDGTVEFSDFANPKRVGVDTLVAGVDTVVIGFDFTENGDSIVAGTIINTVFQSVGVRLAAVLTNGPHAGEFTDTQALDSGEAPNLLSQVGISPPNILSAVDPDLGPQFSGGVAGLATLIVTFVTPSGEPAKVSQVGAFNDLIFGNNTLTAYAGSDASGQVLGTASASGPGDFFGLGSSAGIGSVTFSGHSTEIDDLVFTPIFLDCNDNGVPDRCDVASGTSQDNNGNGIPDDCDGSDDDDGDGVINGSDTCANTPSGETVDTVGCSCSQKDTDADGVDDCNDTCTGTSAGDSVYADGCTVITLSANAGLDQTASQGDIVNVTGAGSVLTGDYPVADLVYKWTQTGGDPADFWFSSPPLGVDTTGTSGDLTFTLTVSTADGSVSATDSFIVAVACSATIMSIEPPNGEAETFATAVNDLGQVVGWCGKADAPFLWDSGVTTGLDTLGGVWGLPHDITESGEVAGQAKIPSGQNHAVIWPAGAYAPTDMQIAGQCGGCNGDMVDTNEAGVSGGWSEWTSPIHSLQATLWYSDGTYAFVTPDGYRNGLVLAVAETGDVLIGASKGNPYNLGSETDGFLLSLDGTFTDLGKVGTHPYLRPVAISAAGIVGRAHGDGPDNGFLWVGGTLTDLGIFVPTDINAAGDIVGASNGYAAVMRGGVVIDLNDLLSTGSGWVLTSASGINANGRIVGTGVIGGLTRGFVMDLCN